MKLPIFAKLFITLLLSTAVVIAAMIGSTHWLFRQGFTPEEYPPRPEQGSFVPKDYPQYPAPSSHIKKLRKKLAVLLPDYELIHAMYGAGIVTRHV